MKNKNSLLVQLRDFGMGPMLGMFISMLTVPIITRLVSPEQFGKSSLFTLVQTIFNLVVLLGLDQSYVRFYNQKDIDKKNLLFNCLLIPVSFCVIVVIGVIIFAQKVSFFMFGQYEPLIIGLFSIFLPTLILNRFAFLSIRMELKGKIYSILNVFQQILNFFVLLAFLYFYEKTFKSIVLATIISTFFSTSLALFFSQQLSQKHHYTIDTKLINRLFQFGLPLVPASILSWVLNSFDKVALRTWSTFDELGLYAASFKIVSILAVVQSIFTTTWTPVAYKWYEEKIPNKKFEDVSTVVMSIMIISFSLLIVSRNVVMFFLGPEYRNTAEIFVFLLFIPVLYTISETTCLGIGFAKKTMYTLYISIICALSNLIGNFILVPKYGALGAAVSTSVSYIVFFWARTLFSRKLWFRMKLGKYILITILMSLFALNILIWKSIYIEICVFCCVLCMVIVLCRRIYIQYRGNL